MINHGKIVRVLRMLTERGRGRVDTARSLVRVLKVGAPACLREPFFAAEASNTGVEVTS